MQTLLHAIRCLACGYQGAGDPYQRHCERCRSPWLDARYRTEALPDDWRQQLAARPTTLWRYRELLPLPADLAPVSMGEGWTPLLRAEGLERELGHEGIWIKDERQQPTGSFKDRQAALTVSALRARGVDEMVLASTGNAAAAYAAFCARAAIKLWVFLASSVPAEKMRELALYGAEVVKITGTYDQAKEVATNFAARRGIFLDGGAKAVFGKESMKTIAFEIAEQAGWQVPDWYVQAVSGGIGPLGVLKGFQELQAAGLVERVPRLALVQVDGCAPMVRAWQQGLAEAPAVQPDTLITVLATGDPGLAYTLLHRDLAERGGAMVAVSDGEAFRAMRRLARTEGFSVEPAASVAFAGLEKLVADGTIRPGERVVVNCSGHTFSTEKHTLEDRYILHLQMEMASPSSARPALEGLGAALQQLDEQVTTIVIIDDNPHDSRLVRRLLQSYKDYRIFEAHTGPDGIDLVRQRQPDLVVLDLTLPDMDGFSILAALKADERTRRVPVMVMSAKSLTTEERDLLRRLDTDSVWQKGNFNTRELVGHVVRRLGGELTQADAGPAARREMEGMATFGGTERQRILVVDDNRLDARLMRRLFEARQRFEVIEAHSAREALATLERQPPALILLDLVLPDQSGETLLETLRTRPDTRSVPVIVVSAKDIAPPARAHLAEQVDSVWTKGVMDRSSFLAHVETLLPE